MTQLFKRHLPDILVVLAFVVIAFAYFFPADTEGRILYRHDSSAGRVQEWRFQTIVRRPGRCPVGQTPCSPECLLISLRLPMTVRNR